MQYKQPRAAVRALELGAIIPVLAILLAACGSSSPSGSAESSSESAESSSESAQSATDSGSTVPADVEAARALLPESVKSDGILTIAGEFEYPPFEMRDADGNFTGIDYDIGNLMADVLGLEPEWLVMGFTALIPAVESGKAEFSMEGINITDERLKIVSFVKYMSNTNTVLVLKGNPKSIDATDLCGTKLAAQAGTIELDIMSAISDQCVKDGKEPINQVPLQTTPAVILALQAGQVDGFVESLPSCAYHSAQSPEFECTTTSVPNTLNYVGAVVAKDNVGLGEAMTAALKVAQNDGRYLEVLKKYGVEATAVDPEFVQ